MNYWIVKGKKAMNDLKTMLYPDQVDRWETARLPLKIVSGDKVVLWDGAPELRAVGIAKVGEISRDKDSDGLSHFDLHYRSLYIATGPTIAELRMDPLFEGCSFLKAGPAGTVFPLTEEQANWLVHRLNTTWTDGCQQTAANFIPSPGQTYKVLSLHPTWAWAIIFAGKDIENRSWSTRFRGILLIHASTRRYSKGLLKTTREQIQKCSGLSLSRIPEEIPTSSILGAVEVEDCIQGSRSKWAIDGETHWVINLPRPLSAPIPNVLGKLGLWSWTCA